MSLRLLAADRVDIRGVGFDDLTEDIAADAIMSHARSGDGLAAVYTPNSEIVQRCVEDKSGRLYEIINSAALVVPDSVGIVKAAKMFGTPVTGKVAGVELGERVLAESAKEGVPVFFLGGKPGVAEEARDRMCERYAGLHVVGCADGYFEKSGEQTAARIEEIAKSGARIVYVCLGAPTQETWIYENRDALAEAGVRVAIALGGALDVYAGEARRAPKIFIALGLEWLYRLIREPSRIGRMTALPRFYIGCRKEAAKRKKSWGRRLVAAALIIGVIVAAYALVINAVVMGATDDKIVGAENAADFDADMIIVLGAGVKKDGRPSDMLYDRISVGVGLYLDGAAPYILMSGDSSREYYDEVGPMTDIAVGKGVPRECILQDPAGLSTYESIYRAKEVFGAERIIIVTQEYHLYRALYIAKALGVEAVGVSADLRGYRGQGYRELREVLARNKDFLYVIWRPEPTYGSEK